MKIKRTLVLLAAGLGTAVSLMAGAFVLQIGKPSSNPEAQAKNAALVVRGYACVEQEKTTVTGTAEGIVNGQRETVRLKLIPLSAESSYAVTQQWPNNGKWVVTFVLTNPHFGQQSAIVKVDGGTVDWAGVMRINRAATSGDIEEALNATTVAAR
jgi:hypothetical protein